MEEKYKSLSLRSQLCFPLYAASREMIKRYRPHLDKLGLTYTQYIVMMVFWEEKTQNVKQLGEKLYLDSGTLTPVLKTLEAKGYLVRTRSKEDERVLNVEITAAGEALKDEALAVPQEMMKHIALEREETYTLYKLLHKLLEEAPEFKE
ncbi:MAG: MarR family transcriptional regulator [Clostridia bacterium]|nr:MarR family transcriptional regulator [Clostridia bacterium]